MRAEEIIINPMLTEKSTHLREKFNKYCFIVSEKANKIEIERAVKELFNVEAVKVNILTKKGKLKRVRSKYGYTAEQKKCIVTLKKGDKISLFEGV